MRWAAISLLLMGSMALAQSQPIDTRNSTITIRAYKSGFFSFAAHDHVINAPIASGTLDLTQRAIEFLVEVKDMQVLDPGESDKNKAEIRSTMVGDKLLDAEKYPEIRFHSTEIRELTPTTFDVRGELTIHGVARPMALRVIKEGDRYVGQTKMKQTDFGLTPVSIAAGTVKVKDEVAVEFSLK